MDISQNLDISVEDQLRKFVLEAVLKIWTLRLVANLATFKLMAVSNKNIIYSR